MLKFTLPLTLATTLLGACGSPANLDVCHAGCDASQRCGLLSDSAASNCHRTCDDNRGSLSDKDRSDDARCQNAGSIRAEELKCQQSACNQILGCLARIDRTCVTR